MKTTLWPSISSSWLLLDLTVLALLGTASALCFDGCYHASDGFCDDGGPGSEYSDCALGHDCTDCGDSERAPSPPAPCVDACFYGRVAVYRDGSCDDGGPGSETSTCDPGNDCTDCSGALVIEPVYFVVIGVVGGFILLVCLACCCIFRPWSRTGAVQPTSAFQRRQQAAQPAAELQPVVQPPSGGGGPSIAVAQPMAAPPPAYTSTPVTVPSAASAPTPVVQGLVVAAAPPGGVDLSTQLTRLADLRAAGQLTEAEYAAAKEKVLSA